MKVTAIDRLQRVVDTVCSGKTLAEDDAIWLFEATQRFFDGDAGLEPALGIGQPASLTSDGVATRADLVCQAAAFYTGRLSRIAKDMAMDAGRYAAIDWRHDRVRTESLSRHHGNAKGLFFELHRNAETGACWPLGWRSILAILQIGALSIAKNLGHDRD